MLAHRRWLQFEHLLLSLKVLVWLNDFCFLGASITLMWKPWFMRWALAPNTPHFQLFLMSPCYPPRPAPATLFQVPRSQEKHTDEFLITCLKHLHISESITHKKGQGLGNQSAFYFTVHSCKFLHFQGNQITFRLALLVTKLYNYPGFKSKIG